MIVEMPPLDERRSAIRVEEASALAPRVPRAGINYAIRATALEPLSQLLRCLVIVRSKGRMAPLTRASQVVQIGVNRQDDLSELRRPASFLSGARHETLVVVDCLEQRRLERVANVENAEGAIGETARPVGADMGERRHQVGCAMAADSALDRNEIEVADARCDPWIALLLGRNQQRPIGGIGDVFE